jgi:hypothetical protein
VILSDRMYSYSSSDRDPIFPASTCSATSTLTGHGVSLGFTETGSRIATPGLSDSGVAIPTGAGEKYLQEMGKDRGEDTAGRSKLVTC